MGKRVLFLVNGLGLGNSTRCHAVIESLIDNKAEVTVATSGNGLWYFRDYLNFPRVIEIDELHYGKKGERLSIAATFASLGTFYRVLNRNAEIISTALKNFSPDVAVTDSVYTFKPMRKFGVPIVSLNNADVVYKSFFKFKGKPASIYPQFFLVELMDYLYHKKVADAVISPTLDADLPGAAAKFHRVGPIVRASIKPVDSREDGAKVVIMLSGSTFSSKLRFKKKSYPMQIDVVGRSKPDGEPDIPNVTYHGKIRNSPEILQDADLLVINGGFSAVSEGFVLKKPLLVIPVPNHAEQWINARIVEKLGVGMMATEDTFEDIMFQALETLPKFSEAYCALPPAMGAAERAADLILEAAG